MNRLAAEAEIPIDHFDRAVQNQLVQSGLLSDLAPTRFRGRLGRFQMPFGKTPVLVRISNQQKPHRTVRPATIHHAAGARLALGAGLGLTALPPATAHENSKCARKQRMRNTCADSPEYRKAAAAAGSS